MPTLSTTNRRNPNAHTLVVREYESLTGLQEDEQRDLERFALDEEGDGRSVLTLRNGLLHAQNYVGVIETRRGTVIEILPKIDLSDSGVDNTRKHLYGHACGIGRASGERNGRNRQHSQQCTALTCSRSFVHTVLDERHPANPARPSPHVPNARSESPLPARAHPVPDAHPRESGRIVRRFYVGYDEFTADRPANRLIRLALQRLAKSVRHPANRQRLHQLRIAFSEYTRCQPTWNDDWALPSSGPLHAAIRHRNVVGPVVPVRVMASPPSPGRTSTTPCWCRWKMCSKIS